MQEIPNFLIKMLSEQYEKTDLTRIINGYNVNRKVSLRANSLKTNIEKLRNELEKNNIDYKEVNWYKDGLIIENAKEEDIQKLSIYKNGEIYLQSLSSMLPPIVLEPMEKEDILDMAAAPGGKTTQIAAISKNKANITAVEINKIRIEKLKYNIEKQGAKVFIMAKDSRQIDNFFKFDKILLDSPCSGSGTISIYDKNLNKYFTENLIEKSVKTQEILLKKAIQILKPGGKIVYSTCSILKQENEDILEKVLKNPDISIEPIKINSKIGINPIEIAKIDEIPQLPTTIPGTLCVCPTELYEGFFVAKLVKKNK